MLAKNAEDAEFWAVYEWRPSKYVLEGSWDAEIVPEDLFKNYEVV